MSRIGKIIEMKFMRFIMKNEQMWATFTISSKRQSEKGAIKSERLICSLDFSLGLFSQALACEFS